MTWRIAVMYAVAAALAFVGAGLLAALTRPRTAGQVYAFRMTGIMAVAAGIVLATGATAMWRWSVAP